jgi:ribulose-5-phosphate 4-epimerase/fuculose-1-phosphate aldolase
MADRHSLEAAKVEVAIGNRILAEVGLAAGVRASLGHVSLRVPGDPNLFVVKGRGYRMDVLSRMRPEDMVVCDLEGNWVDGPPYSLQCSEVKIHSCIYKNRPDVVSVVHVHPDYVVLMSVLQNDLKPMAQEGQAGHQTTARVPPPRSSPRRKRARRWLTCWAAGLPVAGPRAVTASSTGWKARCWRWCIWNTRRG